MSTCTKLWNNASDIIAKELEHPFCKELAQNTLPLEKFKYYLQQDALYILKYAEAMALLAKKAPTPQIEEELLKLSAESYEIEHLIQKGYFNKLKIEETTLMQPACLSYSSFLLATISTRPFIIGLTALLPCFWVYLKVGEKIYRDSVPNNRFQNWIDTYKDEQFNQQTNWLIELIDTYSIAITPTLKEEQMQVFRYSCNLDLQFWTDAYNMRRW